MLRVVLLLCASLLLAHQASASINCYVSPPDLIRPFIPPALGAPIGSGSVGVGYMPPILRAYNSAGLPYLSCGSVYLSYNIPTVNSTYKSFTGWVYSGNVNTTSIALCEASNQVVVDGWVASESGSGTDIYLRPSGLSCCNTDACNTPGAGPANGAERHKPHAVAVLASAVVGAVLLRALWL